MSTLRSSKVLPKEGCETQRCCAAIANGRSGCGCSCFASRLCKGFDHCIANMTFFSLATMLDCPVQNHGDYWLNLLLSTLGNTLGASMLAASYFFTYMQEEACRT
eukprot:4320404-Amphidinium_carterae.1